MSQKRVFSFTKGYTFKFEDEGKQINAWFSALTGREKVYVDGELVSSQMNYSTNSSNSFKIGPNEYSTNLKVESLLKGPFMCTLVKNKKEYKRQKLLFPIPKVELRKGLIILTMYVAFAFLFVFVNSYWQLTKEWGYLYLAAVIVFMVYFSSKYIKGAAPVIEDEDIS